MAVAVEPADLLETAPAVVARHGAAAATGVRSESSSSMAANPAPIGRALLVGGPIVLALLVIDGGVIAGGRNAAFAVAAAVIAGASAAWSP